MFKESMKVMLFVFVISIIVPILIILSTISYTLLFPLFYLIVKALSFETTGYQRERPVDNGIYTSLSKEYISKGNTFKLKFFLLEFTPYFPSYFDRNLSFSRNR